MQTQKTRRQHGLWESPVTPISLARGMTLENPFLAGDGSLLWLEGRSDLSVLVVQPPDGQAWRDLNSEYSVRGRLGYGGGEFTAGHGLVFFIDAASGRIFRQPLASGIARPVTPAFGQAASPTLSPDGRWLAFVHTYEGQDTLAVVDADGSLWPQKLVSGDDFYMQPTWSPDGRRMAWVAWNHPNMPFDGAFLRMGTVCISPTGLPALEDVVTLAGDERTVVFQPEFSPDGRGLAYVSDASGWGQLYFYDLEQGQARQLTHVQAEHGEPAWVQGQRRFGFSPDGQRLYFLRNQAGFASLWQIDLEGGTEQRLTLGEEYTALRQLSVSPASEPVGERVALLASGASTPERVVTYQPAKGVTVWRRSTPEELPPGAYSQPEPIEWQGMDGEAAYGLLFPPANERYEGIGQPPLIVHVHGGPTSQVTARFNPRAQFFTSRGYAFLEVNYRGSTGYGRAYQDKLQGNWGIYDVQDSVSGARFLAEQGRVDSSKLVIMGGSAGGFTVLKALEDYPGFFKAGICMYGVANQFNLASDTHKFEARYSDMLLGPLPEASDVYRDRSPIYFTDKIQDALAVFQGEVDQVVPRNQSDELVESLRRRGVPHIYHVYPGEGHGFRKVETIQHFYESVDKFLRQYVIFA